MSKARSLIAALALAAVNSGCEKAPAIDVYTLYRSSPVDSAMRVHWATFDANQSDGYNQENCLAGAEAMMAIPGVTVRYWCEKGRYRP